MSNKPNAIKMLKLLPYEFIIEVSRAISPKPWRHDTDQLRCGRCGLHEYLARPSHCPTPPALTETPEQLAFRLRDELCKNPDDGRIVDAAVECRGHIQKKSFAEDAHVATDWYAWDATPAEQIAVCLVALEKWRVG